MNKLIILSFAFSLASCTFEKADYYKWRYDENVDFGVDVGNSSGSTFDYSGSSYDKAMEKRQGVKPYMGQPPVKEDKTDYFRHYRGSTDE